MSEPRFLINDIPVEDDVEVEFDRVQKLTVENNVPSPTYRLETYRLSDTVLAFTRVCNNLAHISLRGVEFVVSDYLAKPGGRYVNIHFDSCVITINSFEEWKLFEECQAKHGSMGIVNSRFQTKEGIHILQIHDSYSPSKGDQSFDDCIKKRFETINSAGGVAAAALVMKDIKIRDRK